MRSNGKMPRTVPRDPERTRRRILAAALAEFSAHGFAGARVDTIARRARGNKRMLYHYFGNKEELFTAVLRQKMAERISWGATLPNDPAERLPFWFETACSDLGWTRLLEWEALQLGAKKMIDEAERRQDAAGWRQRLHQRQKDGELTSEFDACHIALAMQALTIFPAAFPQLIRLYTGKSIQDPKFRSDYKNFLKEFAAAFRPRKRTAK